jgi:alkylation response protein AidB-like acyl-CoA dehydrogenase
VTVAKYLDLVADVAKGPVAAQADVVDRRGEFPSQALEAMGKAGLLGLICSPDVGGMGMGAREAALVVERLARDCGSTAMVVCMHYAGAAVVELLGATQVRRQIAAGQHLCSLALAEGASRLAFWEPTSTAARVDAGIRLDARKCGVTAAHHAHSFIWSSRAVDSAKDTTLWLVPRETANLSVVDTLDGLGLRGNNARHLVAEAAIVGESNRMGRDGEGQRIINDTVLPLFSVMSAGCCIGLMEGAVARVIAHVADTRYPGGDASLAQLPVVREHVARMRIATDQARAFWLDAIAALEQGKSSALVRVLECRVAASEAANDVLDAGMRICGGAAFRRDVGIERAFRDARAVGLTTPTPDQLYEVIGRVVCEPRKA